MIELAQVIKLNASSFDIQLDVNATPMPLPKLVIDEGIVIAFESSEDLLALVEITKELEIAHDACLAETDSANADTNEQTERN